MDLLGALKDRPNTSPSRSLTPTRTVTLMDLLGALEDDIREEGHMIIYGYNA